MPTTDNECHEFITALREVESDAQERQNQTLKVVNTLKVELDDHIDEFRRHEAQGLHRHETYLGMQKHTDSKIDAMHESIKIFVDLKTTGKTITMLSKNAATVIGAGTLVVTGFALLWRFTAWLSLQGVV